MDYKDKKESYYNSVRLDLLNFLPKDTKNKCFLEVGAGYGATLSYLKDKKIAKEVIGIDIPVNKGKSKFSNIDKFIYENIENLDLTPYENYFDFIILADVLEHLINPNEVLKKLKPLLNENGKILISIPNFRHKKSIHKVFIKGDFSYEESGLFDYTHLRFFCKKNIINLVVESGFNIEEMVSSLKTYKQFSVSKIFNFLTFNIFEEFLTVQYLLSIKNNGN